jgi:uncharacterized protein YjbI with pentapeptide repeats
LNKENKEKVKKNVCQIKYCGRPTHKESKYCIFHAKPEEKEEKEFKKSFEEYIEEIKRLEKSQYDFKQFIFIGDINFKEDFKISTFKNADFSGSIFKGKVGFFDIVFEGDTSFEWAAFFKDVNFYSSTFVEEARFSFATFKEEARFFAIKFKGNAKFNEANFKGYSNFSAVNFYNEADYRGSTFEENIEFSMGVTFKGDALFSGVVFESGPKFYITTIEPDKKELKTVFEGLANFQGVVFKDDPIFDGAIFKSNVVSSGASFPTRSRLFLKVINGNKLLLDGSLLENIFLELDLGENVMVSLNDVTLRNSKIERKEIFNRILQEQEKKFSEAKNIYLHLKNNFHSIGRYEDESWAFKKEKDMERKSYFHFKSLHKWLWSCFLNAIYGYGEKPGRVIVSAILVILLFASLFMIFGISNVGIEFNTSNNFLDCMYFSTITFTTLGYGDFRPLEGWGRILAGSEAFIGAFMMALFVYTFARRTGGR